MNPLDQAYLSELEDLATQIQESEELAAFLESEDEADYATLRETFEPALAELYRNVAVHQPLQLIALEEAMLDGRLEGLFLSKVLGFTVLRGPVNENFQYHYPQEQFKKVLLAICHSSNFEEIRKRIGQTIQIGFALSSHIWVSNLLEEVENRQVRQFLQAQVLAKYHDRDQRKDGYERYSGQFRSEIFFTADLPDNLPALRRSFPSIKQFLGRRIQLGLDNTMLLGPVFNLISNKELFGSYEHRYLFVQFVNFFETDAAYQDPAAKILNELRKKEADFSDHYFAVLAEFHHGGFDVSADCDRRVAAMLDRKVKDDMASFYDLVIDLHSKGYVHPEVIEAVSQFYTHHQGVSLVNECVRLTVFRYLRQFLANITETDYQELFDISRICAAYFKVFDNEYFRQDVENLSMDYLHKLLKVYTDKRGKDYQDIKRFVQTTFVDLGFLTEKEVVELFKSRRKKKTEE